MSPEKEKKKQKYFIFGADKQMRGGNFQPKTQWFGATEIKRAVKRRTLTVKVPGAGQSKAWWEYLRLFRTLGCEHILALTWRHTLAIAASTFSVRMQPNFSLEMFYILQSQYDCHFQVAWWWHHVLNTTNMATQHYCYAFSIVVLIFNLPIIFLYWRLSATRCVVTKSPRTPQ